MEGRGRLSPYILKFDNLLHTASRTLCSIRTARIAEERDSGIFVESAGSDSAFYKRYGPAERSPVACRNALGRHPRTSWVARVRSRRIIMKDAFAPCVTAPAEEMGGRKPTFLLQRTRFVAADVVH